MEKYNEIAGLIPETELDDMVSDNTVGGSSWVCLGIAVVGGTIAVTKSWDFCPTNGCTDYCVK